MEQRTARRRVGGTEAAHPLTAWIRSWPAVVQDAVLTVAVLAVQYTLLVNAGSTVIPPGIPARPVDGWAYVIITVSTLPLMVRRRFPFVALVVALAALLVFADLNYAAPFTGYAMIAALYSVVVYRGMRIGLWAAALNVAVLQLAYLITDLPVALSEVLLNVLVVATGVGLGDGTRNRLAAEAANEARLAQLAADHDRRSREALAAERTRIARELHDQVAHSMSVIAVQAGVGNHLIDADPAKAKEALGTIESTSRQALNEMRRMLGVLRTGDEAPAELGPQPGLEALDGLLDDVRRAGLPVELTVEGERRPLDPAADLAAFRIIQESLTNVIKHAGPASVSVHLGYGPDRLTLTVDDDGRGAAALPTSSSPPDTVPGDDPSGPGDHTGMGLIGMRERAGVAGGAVSAGPRAGGGFRVRAVLPYALDPSAPTWSAADPSEVGG